MKEKSIHSWDMERGKNKTSEKERGKKVRKEREKEETGN